MAFNINNTLPFLNEINKRMLLIDETAADTPYAEGKWTRKMMLGHLIDSAANNHLRFVNGQFSEDLVFHGYDHTSWVSVQNYSARSWHDLVEFWFKYNVHLFHVVVNMPEIKKNRKFDDHNFHEICWKKAPAESPATLGYLIEDYYGHMVHHLDQIFS